MKPYYHAFLLAAALLAPGPSEAFDPGPATAAQPPVEVDAWPLRLSQVAATDPEEGTAADLTPGELRGSVTTDDSDEGDGL